MNKRFVLSNYFCLTITCITPDDKTAMIILVFYLHVNNIFLTFALIKTFASVYTQASVITQH